MAKHYPVYYSKCENYSPDEVRRALEKVLQPQIDAVGGVRGKSVLIKPNLLTSRNPEDPTCVHPRVILETASCFIRAGAERVAVMETPATKKVSSILSAMGIADELDRMGVSYGNFTNYQSEKNTADGTFFQNIEIAQEYHGFDFVANLAKAKTHAMMTLTLCVKNLFGFVNGGNRIAWHLAVGRDYAKFADMLLDLYLNIHPRFNVLDAVVCMEGNGPGNGTPAVRNFLAGSNDALSLDSQIATLFRCQDIPIMACAKARNLLPQTTLSQTDCPFPVQSLELPTTPQMDLASLHLGVGIPKFAQKFLHHTLLAKPRLHPRQCVGCGLCVRMCPPKSLTMRNGRPRFDLRTCIRCYCCQEHCPQGAITVKRSTMMNILRFFHF